MMLSTRPVIVKAAGTEVNCSKNPKKNTRCHSMGPDVREIPGEYEMNRVDPIQSVALLRLSRTQCDMLYISGTYYEKHHNKKKIITRYVHMPSMIHLVDRVSPVLAESIRSTGTARRHFHSIKQSVW